MEKIQIFENPEFGQVRVFIEDGKPLFVAKDVAVLLGYSNPAEAIATHCKSSDIEKRYIAHENGIGGTNIQVIHESNLYRLIMGSKLPNAIKFQDWVVEEVLPSIRRTGSYSVQQSLPQTFAEALRAYADEVEKSEALRLENAQQKQIIGELQPKVNYYHLILSSQDCLTVTQIAKDYGLTAQFLNKKLKELGVQFKQSGQWLLKDKHANSGYTKSETVTYQKQDGSIGTVLHTKWTQVGRLFLYELLKANGILPTIEQE